MDVVIGGHPAIQAGRVEQVHPAIQAGHA